MKILHASHGFPPLERTGVDTHVYQLAQVQVRLGHEVYVFCRSGIKEKQEYALGEEEIDGINVTRINNNFVYASYNPFVCEQKEIDGRFDAYLRRISPDVVHIHHLLGLSAHIPTIIQQRKVPYVVTLHDFWYLCTTIFLLKEDFQLCAGPRKLGNQLVPCHHDDKTIPRGFLVHLKSFLRIWPKLPVSVQNALWYKNAFLRKLLIRPARSASENTDIHLQRLQHHLGILQGASSIISPSEFVRRMYTECGVLNIQLLGHPLDKKSLGTIQRKIPNGTINFGYIGTFLAYKGIKLLVDAFHSLRDTNCRLYLYGREGVDIYTNTYVRAIAKRDERIVMRGPFDYKDIRTVYEHLDVVVVPSICNESYSYVVHEALYVGIPVIGSDIETFTACIRDGENGYVFKRNNQHDLTRVMERMIKERLFAKKVTNALPEHDIHSYAGNVFALYAKAVQRSAAQGLT